MDVEEAARQIRANTVYHGGAHVEDHIHQAIPMQPDPLDACRCDERSTIVVSSEVMCQAYAALEDAEEKLFQSEEARIEAAIARETAYLAAINEAVADGITDPGRQQQKAQRATREQLTTLHQAEKASRAAQHGYKLAGIRLDCLNRQIQLAQLLQERSK